MKKNNTGAPVLDAHLLKEQQAKLEQERIENEKDKVRFAVRTEQRRKMFATNTGQTTSSAEQSKRKNRGRNKLLEALARNARKEADSDSADLFLEEDDLHSADQYSMSFAQPCFDSILKTEKEYNSDMRVRRYCVYFNEWDYVCSYYYVSVC